MVTTSRFKMSGFVRFDFLCKGESQWLTLHLFRLLSIGRFVLHVAIYQRTYLPTIEVDKYGAVAQGGDPCAGTSPGNAWAQVAGYITIDGAPSPVGTVVTMHNPAGDKVGCRVTDTEGLYGWTYVKGYSGVNEPHMQEGEEVGFRVNGHDAVASPVFYWTDGANLQVDLTVVIPLAELTGAYALEGRPDHGAVLRVNLYEVGAATPSYSFTPTGSSGANLW